jgi:hypothetical protein
MHQIPGMKRATEHMQGVIDVAESDGDIDDGIGGHLGHVRSKKQRKIDLARKEEGNSTGLCTRLPG